MGLFQVTVNHADSFRIKTLHESSDGPVMFPWGQQFKQIISRMNEERVFWNATLTQKKIARTHTHKGKTLSYNIWHLTQMKRNKGGCRHWGPGDNDQHSRRQNRETEGRWEDRRQRLTGRQANPESETVTVSAILTTIYGTIWKINFLLSMCLILR